MQSIIGKIRDINRYPVKSLAGETLEVCDIESYGLAGDRYCAFYDETKEGWSRFVTARNIPSLLSYHAKFIDGDIEVTTPDGTVLGWDEQLLNEIQKLSKKPLTMSRLRDPHPQFPHLLSVDEASVLLVTDASLRRLEEVWGQPVDHRRFRGNFVVAVTEDSIFEGDWIGQRLGIGEAELQIDSYCERCVMITMDPDNLDRDSSLLKKVHQDFSLRFGVYASVVKPGRVQLGDQVKLLDNPEADVLRA